MHENLLIKGDASDPYGEVLPDDMRFDLVYLDPPFGTGQVMTTRDKTFAYDDRIPPVVLGEMIHKIAGRVRNWMADRALLFVHLDHRFVHEAKVTIDRTFGRDNFRGEIIWSRGNGTKGKGIPSSHDTILVWSKGKEYVWNNEDESMREPFAETSLGMHFNKKDEAGRLYREKVVKGRTYRYYADEGKRIGSVWTDCPSMNANSPISTESTGYPTQKPEKLLERIIRGASNEGDVVADLMCGSGTTLAVAHRLNRRWVGMDLGDPAIDTTQSRLNALGASYRLVI